jgi:hypothetical protein
MAIDAIYTLSPDQDGQPMTLGTKFKATDINERMILNEITNITNDLQTNEVCFLGDKKAGEHFFGLIINLTDALFKANNRRKNYQRRETKLIKKFKRESLKNPNKHIDLSEHPIDLFNELDGYLTDLKSSLDALAKVISPLLGSNLDGWHKGLDSNKVEKSGIKILKYLNNLPTDKKILAEKLYKYILGNIDFITYVVFLRDQPVHKGGISKVSGLIFRQTDKKVVHQQITHPDGTVEKVSDFINRIMPAIIKFISNVLLLSIQFKSPGLVLHLVHDDKNGDHFAWGIPHTN